ncbi:MAG: hypothetical protein QOI20_2769 [Acidimicrobiaceae bacterium]|jgi:uncharacterized membrane protein|nr:hypothetical protein [Acidimicrobiaceae bacterium]
MRHLSDGVLQTVDMGHSHGEQGADGVVLPRHVRRLLAIAIAPFAVATAVAVMVLWPAHTHPKAATDLGQPGRVVNATVGDVSAATCQGGGRCFTVFITITSGPDKGETAVLSDLSFGPGSPRLNDGDRIVVGRTVDPTNQRVFYSFADFQRRTPLLLLLVFFALVVAGVARWRGIAALIGLGITGAVLLRFTIPAILEGESPVAVSLTAGAVILFVVLYLAHGFNGRTTTALLGTLASLGLTAVLASGFVAASHLSGLSSEEATYVQFLTDKVSVTGLLLAGVVIGALGVLNDVTVTQASAVWEIHAANPTRGMRALYRSGMRVGRDHIASVVDTLVLAYAGASLPLLIIFTFSGQHAGTVLTSDVVAEEVVRALVGSIGLIASVPITTALAAFVVTRTDRLP